MIQVTLDESGRIQLPQSVIEQLRLNHERELTLEIQENKLVLVPIPEEPEVYYEDGVLVFNGKLPEDLNLETFIDEQRQERIKQFWS